jgi:hypothetical protein
MTYRKVASDESLADNSTNSSTGGPNVLLDGDDNTTTGAIWGTNVNSYDESPASGSSVIFVIHPYESASVSFSRTADDKGYGVIEWVQSSDNLNALIGVVIEQVTKEETSRSRMSRSIVPINNGATF